MAQPVEYNRQYNFTNYQALQPTAPLPGDEVDNEFNAAKVTLDEIRARLALIQRDDGRLANGSVGNDQLAAVISGLQPPTNWETALAYNESAYVLFGGSMYLCEEDHTSGTFGDDLAAGKWSFIFNFGEQATQTTADRLVCEAAEVVAQDTLDAIAGLSAIDGGRADSVYTSTDPFDGGGV
jgi:hypothetical protein